MLDLECIVYMGAVDCERQKLNCFRMAELGATVVPVQVCARLGPWARVRRRGAPLTLPVRTRPLLRTKIRIPYSESMSLTPHSRTHARAPQARTGTHTCARTHAHAHAHVHAYMHTHA
jgi:hypothetical protein